MGCGERETAPAGHFTAATEAPPHRRREHEARSAVEFRARMCQTSRGPRKNARGRLSRALPGAGSAPAAARPRITLATGGVPPACPNPGARPGPRDPVPSRASLAPRVTIATQGVGRGVGAVLGRGAGRGGAGCVKGRAEGKAVDSGGGTVAAGVRWSCCEGAGAAGRAPRLGRGRRGPGLRVGGH